MAGVADRRSSRAAPGRPWPHRGRSGAVQLTPDRSTVTTTSTGCSTAHGGLEYIIRSLHERNDYLVQPVGDAAWIAHGIGPRRVDRALLHAAVPKDSADVCLRISPALQQQNRRRASVRAHRCVRALSSSPVATTESAIAQRPVARLSVRAWRAGSAEPVPGPRIRSARGPRRSGDDDRGARARRRARRAGRGASVASVVLGGRPRARLRRSSAWGQRCWTACGTLPGERVGSRPRTAIVRDDLRARVPPFAVRSARCPKRRTSGSRPPRMIAPPAAGRMEMGLLRALAFYRGVGASAYAQAARAARRVASRSARAPSSSFSSVSEQFADVRGLERVQEHCEHRQPSSNVTSAIQLPALPRDVHEPAAVLAAASPSSRSSRPPTACAENVTAAAAQVPPGLDLSVPSRH